MAKRRKKQPNGLPAKGRMQDIANELWSRAVRDDWGNKCAMCGATAGQLDAHHIVSRQHNATKYDLRNGMCLCARHHRWDPDLSPHENAAGFLSWLESHHPELHEWYTSNPRPRFEGTTNVEWYCDQIRRLRQYVEPEEFVRIVGVRFSAYLEENE